MLELVEGETLADRLARGALPLAEAVRIARQIADALGAAHDRGVVHRDLKPANVKVTPDGSAKVLDFGVAKALAAPHGFGAAAALAAGPTVTGTRAEIIIGTPAYMSPEQARGADIDARSDVWAFGAVLYEMLTGAPAFARATLAETLSAVLTSDPA